MNKFHLRETTSSSFFRLTYADVIQDFKEKRITVKGLLYYIVKTTRKDGHKFRIKDVSEFCEQLGISRAAYYKALKSDPLLRFDAIGEMDLWIESTNAIPLHDDVSTFVDSVSTKVDTNSMKVDTSSTKVSRVQTKVDTDIYKERAHDRSSTDLNPDLIQIPLVPKGEKECTEDKSALIEEDSGASTEVLLTEQPCQPINSINDKANHGDKSSAFARDNSGDDVAEYYEHPASKQDAWLRGGYKKPSWAVRRGGNKWIADQDFVQWYAKRESAKINFARDYLQKSGEEDRTSDLWKEYQASLAPIPATESFPTRRDPLEGTQPITPEQVRELREIANLPRSQKK